MSKQRQRLVEEDNRDVFEKVFDEPAAAENRGAVIGALLGGAGALALARRAGLRILKGGPGRIGRAMVTTGITGYGGVMGGIGGEVVQHGDKRFEEEQDARARARLNRKKRK